MNSVLAHRMVIETVEPAIARFSNIALIYEKSGAPTPAAVEQGAFKLLRITGYARTHLTAMLQ